VAPTILVGGLAGLPAFVGFGSAAPGVSVLGETIDLSAAGLLDYAFSVPQDGTINAISATFTVTAALSISIGSVSVQVQLYSAPATSSTFTAVAGATLTLAPPITIVAIGEVLSGLITGINAPVTAGTQLLLVVSAVNSSPLSIASTVTGSISAGVSIC
jgi:BclB C-terminal domain-containing protein